MISVSLPGGRKKGGERGGGEITSLSRFLPSHLPSLPPSLPPSLLADSAGLTISILVGIVLVACRRVSPNR